MKTLCSMICLQAEECMSSTLLKLSHFVDDFARDTLLLVDRNMYF